MPVPRRFLRAVVVLLIGGLALLLLPAVALAQSPPGIPTGVRVTAGDASAVVSWVEPASDGGETISSYTVTTSGGVTATVPGVARSATVTGLTNGLEYRFTVTASNRAGAGHASAVSYTVTPTPVKVSAPGKPLIDEHFATSASNFAPVAGGSWDVASGRYVLSAPADGGESVANANLSMDNTLVTGDFVLTVSAATTPTDSPFNDFSIVFDYQDPSNYYFASFSEGNDAHTSGIFKVAQGTRTELADIATTIVAGTMHPIRIEREGETIRVYRAADQMASASDSTFTSGKVGLGSRNDGGTFDDLVVTGPPPVAPAREAPKGFLARLWDRVTSLFSG